MQVVLERRPRDQQSRVRRERAEHLRELRLLVLHAVRLVDDNRGVYFIGAVQSTLRFVGESFVGAMIVKNDSIFG